MNIQASVIQELRSMFKEGATPSRLIQHIVARHPNEGNWHGLIQDYFREGFGVPIVRGLSPMETYDDIDLRYAFLNEDVLHQMVQSRTTWDHERDESGEASPCWLGLLTATSNLDRLEEAEQLKVRRDLVLTYSGYKGRTEMVHILARLVERLQQRILALERRCSPSVAEESSAC